MTKLRLSVGARREHHEPAKTEYLLVHRELSVSGLLRATDQ